MGAVITAALAGCGNSPPTNGALEGKVLGQTFAEEIQTRAGQAEPYRCARLRDDAALGANAIEGASFDAATATLQLEGDSKSLRVAVVADARGDDQETLDMARKLNQTLEAANTDVLISLGGLAEDGQSVEALLAALIGTSNVLLVALPGDREDVGEHRKAIAKLAQAGARAVDGSWVRKIRIGDVLIVTMPGISKRSNLVAESQGCLHTQKDAISLEETLTDKAPREAGPAAASFVLLASYAPARHSPADVGVGGVEVGERELDALMANERVDLLVHAMVSTPDATQGGGKPRSLPARSLDPLDQGAQALFLRISGKQLTWEHLPVD